jgi:hypothetical protein
MASFTDWLARTFFISAEDEASAKAVAEHQQSLIDRQRDEGKLGAVKYLQQSAEVQNTGADFYDSQLGKSGVAGLPGLAFHYWWIVAIVGVLALIWFWPAIRPVLNRLRK